MRFSDGPQHRGDAGFLILIQFDVPPGTIAPYGPLILGLRGSYAPRPNPADYDGGADYVGGVLLAIGVRSLLGAAVGVNLDINLFCRFA
jgi:hypothetical protein